MCMILKCEICYEGKHRQKSFDAEENAVVRMGKCGPGRMGMIR